MSSHTNPSLLDVSPSCDCRMAQKSFRKANRNILHYNNSASFYSTVLTEYLSGIYIVLLLYILSTTRYMLCINVVLYFCVTYLVYAAHTRFLHGTYWVFMCCVNVFFV